MKKQTIALLEKRRSIYALNNEVNLSDDQLLEMVSHVIHHTPSAFHSQTQNAALLLGDKHSEFWDMVATAIKAIVPAEQFAESEARINSFKAGYGTVLFFEDMNVVKGLQENIPLYKDNFPVWSSQGSAMAQISLWNAFAENEIGASLQHYNELIEDQVKEAFNIDPGFKLIAQMPFGGIVAQAGPKESKPMSERVLLLA